MMNYIIYYPSNSIYMIIRLQFETNKFYLAKLFYKKIYEIYDSCDFA